VKGPATPEPFTATEWDESTPTHKTETVTMTEHTTGTPATRRLGAVVIVLMVFLVLSGLWWSAEDVVQGSTVRIMYVHVPSIWVAYLAFGLTALCSAVYLSGKTRSVAWDRVAGASAEIGVMFVAVSLVTGSLWGRLTWGTYWVWDARLTSELILLFLYFGFMALQASIDDPRRADRAGAMLAIVGASGVQVYAGLKAVVEHRFGFAIAIGIESAADVHQAVPLGRVLRVHQHDFVAHHVGHQRVLAGI